MITRGYGKHPEELNRRIDELDAEVDRLPTGKGPADALRAFADRLDRPHP